MKPGLLAIATVLAAACGDGGGPGSTSGVDPTTNITLMTDQEVMSFCVWAVDQGGGPGHETDCGGEIILVNDTVEECVSKYGNFETFCSATVADAEACISEIAVDPCSFEYPACAPLYDCFPQ